MPNRIIRESALTSATLYRLSDFGERLFFRLTIIADDFGRFEAEAQVIKAKCFPLWPDKRLSLTKIVTGYNELEAADLVKTYIVDGKRYGFFVTWEKYQQRRANRSKFPDPTEDNIMEAPANACLQMLANVPEKREARSEESRSGIGNPSPSREAAAGSGNGWGSPEQLVALYNRLAPDGHPRVTHLSPARRDKARRYLADFPEQPFWVRAFSEIRHSKLLRGLVKSEGHKNFRGDFDWLLTKGKDGSENVVKVAEGKYRDEGEMR